MSRISSENEGQRVVQIVIMNDKWYNKWQRVTMSGITNGEGMTMSDNELQQMKTSDSERQHVEKTNENARKQVK